MHSCDPQKKCSQVLDYSNMEIEMLLLLYPFFSEILVTTILPLVSKGKLKCRMLRTLCVCGGGPICIGVDRFQNYISLYILVAEEKPKRLK